MWCEALSDKMTLMADQRSKFKPFSFRIQKLSCHLLFSVCMKDDSKPENVVVENHISFQNILFSLQSSIYSVGDSIDHYPAIKYNDNEI